ncbi:hypothetical protein DFJ74DRAFT_666741 [Hyaloraphidium curvatum]|nr:hypothetical protein DFJ74DRAFT_666741 [Hyaloraphidium curvatum]
MADRLPLNTEFLFRISLGVGAPQMSTAATAWGGERRVVPVTSGTFSGPSLNGTVVPGTTADWLRVEPDGTAHMDVRLVCKTHKDQTFFMSYTGVRAGAPEVLAKVAKGEASPEDYYFRTAIRFETGDPELMWMNRVLAVGVGHRVATGPFYDVYVIR